MDIRGLVVPIDMTQRRTLLVGVAVLAVIALGVAITVIGPSDFFVPEQSTQVDDKTMLADGQVLKQGSFVGTAGHEVIGTVILAEDEEGLYLRFENYSQTQGPDVYVYVTPASTPDSTQEIREGRKILIDGGADGGESTKEGTFVQRLPDDVSAEDINGIGIWCEGFRTPFGYAELS